MELNDKLQVAVRLAIRNEIEWFREQLRHAPDSQYWLERKAQLEEVLELFLEGDIRVHFPGEVEEESLESECAGCGHSPQTCICGRIEPTREELHANNEALRQAEGL